jgi:hypothetical protein
MWAEPRLIGKVVHRTATVNEDGDFHVQSITNKPIKMTISWAAVPIHGDKYWPTSSNANDFYGFH